MKTTHGMWICVIAVAALALSPPVVAQHPQPKDAAGEHHPPYEIFAGYSYLREDGHDLHGWAGTFIVAVNHGVAFAVDVDGHYGSHVDGAETVDVGVNGFTAGPHVAFPTHSRLTPFAFVLLGGAHERVTTAGVTESTNGFAANLGGGLDLHINEKWAARLIQVDAAYTRFHGEGKTSPRVSAGLVFRFGKPK